MRRRGVATIVAVFAVAIVTIMCAALALMSLQDIRRQRTERLEAQAEAVLDSLKLRCEAGSQSFDFRSSPDIAAMLPEDCTGTASWEAAGNSCVVRIRLCQGGQSVERSARWPLGGGTQSGEQ
ncbi:MAG: hypothetical protein HZB38_18555 [Planctomycetes bacterium]|nr:hypothetical protein [Planctomycetota bacterium]